MKARVAEAAPAFSSERLQLLGPLVSARAIELARERIAEPKRRLVGEKGSLPTGDDAATVKTALLLLEIMNPVERLTNEEQAFKRGITADLYGKELEARAARVKQTPRQ